MALSENVFKNHDFWQVKNSFRATRKRSAVKYTGDDEDDEDDEEEAPPAPKKRGRPSKSSGTKAASSKAKDDGDSGVEDDEEEKAVPKKRGLKIEKNESSESNIFLIHKKVRKILFQRIFF